MDKTIFHVLNGSESLVLDHIMLDITTWWVWLPLYVMLAILVIKNSETIPRMLFTIGMALLCFAMTEIITDVIVKPWVARVRPCNDPTVHSVLVDGYAPEGFSFFSAHAANICGLVTYICLLVRSKSMSIFLCIWALLSCFSRIYLGVHYPLDVVVGMAVGIVVAILCYRLLKVFEMQASTSNHYVSRKLTRAGYAMSDCDEVICILLFLFVCIAIHSVVAN